MIIDIPASQNPRVPAIEHPFRHIVDLQIRFNDIDMLGHLNNSVFLQFLDLGKSRYFHQVVPEAVDWKHVNIVVVNVNCDFFAPVYITEPVAVVTQVTSVGERSLRLEQRIINTDTGEVKCVARTVMAGFDPDTATGAPLHPAWVEALERFEQRPLRKNLAG